MANNYWGERLAKAQDNISNKNLKQIEKQTRKYYKSAAKKVIDDFEATYDKLVATVAAGKQPTPADLYKLDKYWHMQASMREELRKLGERQIVAYTKAFEQQWFDIYYSINIQGSNAFNTVDKNTVTQLINAIWCADGKSWSARVWANTDYLMETLNEELLHTVLSGKKTSDLKKALQERFSVSYTQADTLARTELCHIQTQAAQQRYKDYGIKQVEVFVDEDERTCPICAKHEGERHDVNAQMPVPFHPRCRCCMIPVVEDDKQLPSVVK